MRTDKNFNWQLEEFMLYCKSKDLRERTLKGYEQALRLFGKWCAEENKITEVDRISAAVIRKYITELQQRGKYTYYSSDPKKAGNYPERRRDYRNKISNITINNYLRNIRVFFNWLYDECIIYDNPMKRIKMLKAERKQKEFISDVEYKQLINCLDKSYFSEHRDYTMIILMLDSGMRLGECTMLTENDIDLRHNLIELKAGITKGRHDRTVYFSRKAARILSRWIEFKDRYTDSKYLFPVKSGEKHVSVSSFETNFKHYLKRCEINEEISPHCLRNNFAKRCLMNGMDIYTLSRILGHSSVTVTEAAYLDLNSEDLGKRYQMFSPFENIR